MNILNQAIQLGHDLQATPYELASFLCQALIPKIQLLRVSSLLAEPAQEAVTLAENAVVHLQGPAVTTIYLADAGIEIVAARLRGTSNEVNIFRHEKDRFDLAYQVQHAPLDPIDPYLLLQPIGCLENHYAYLAQGVAPLNLRLQTGEGHLVLVGQPVDQLPIGTGMRGIGGGQVVDGFQKVGLPLGITAL